MEQGRFCAGLVLLVLRVRCFMKVVVVEEVGCFVMCEVVMFELVVSDVIFCVYYCGFGKVDVE